MIPTSQTTWPRLAGMIVAVATAASLAGCERPDDARTAGQKVDDTIAKVEQKAEEVKSDMREAARDAKQAGADVAKGAADKVSEAKQATVNVAEAAADKVKDAVISSVTVDSQNGRVALRGSAPDSVASERAASVASSVDGVVAVDNQLAVSRKP